MRYELDFINKEITSFLIKRMEISKEVALYKHEHGLPVFDEEREEKIIETVRAQSGVYADATEEIFRILFRESKKIQADVLKELEEKEAQADNKL